MWSLLLWSWALRGAGLRHVAVVINYDMASDIDRFTHRVGRTGRAGKTGMAVTFLSDEDAPVFEALKAYLESTKQPVPAALADKCAGGRKGERAFVNK